MYCVLGIQSFGFFMLKVVLVCIFCFYKKEKRDNIFISFETKEEFSFCNQIFSVFFSLCIRSIRICHQLQLKWGSPNRISVLIRWHSKNFALDLYIILKLTLNKLFPYFIYTINSLFKYFILFTFPLLVILNNFAYTYFTL